MAVRMVPAVGTQSFEHVVDRCGSEPFGKRHDRRGLIVKAIDFVAADAVEMGVDVVDAALSSAGARLVKLYASAVFDRMDEMMLLQGDKGAEDTRFVERLQTRLYVAEAERTFG